MSQYICTICGYIYDDAKEKIPFKDLPDTWKCPLCGADKALFKKLDEENEGGNSSDTVTTASETEHDDLHEINNGELSAICSNLARGCEKQYLNEESSLFKVLSDYYASKVAIPEKKSFEDIKTNIKKELLSEYPSANQAASQQNDRGAKRVLTWSEKVTLMTESLLSRYAKEGSRMLQNNKIWVCDICGFIYIGNEPPAICPICKVPNFKILEVK